MKFRERNIFLIIIIVLAIAGGIWFGYFKNTWGETSRISGKVTAINGSTITVEGVIEGQSSDKELRREVKTATFYLTQKTQFIKTVYLMDANEKPGEAYTPEWTEEPGALSDISPGVRVIEADVKGNLFDTNSANAIKINYAVFK